MRDQWMVGFVVAVSAIALAGSVLFAVTRPSAESIPADDDEAGTGSATRSSRETRAEDTEEGTTGALAAGKVVFEKRCTRCHTVDEIVDYVREQPETERTAWLERLLSLHYPPPKNERPSLIDYLIQSTNARK